jgi:hypothetical protein
VGRESDACRCESRRSCGGELVQAMRMVAMQRTVARRSSEADVGQIRVTGQCERSYQT